MKLPHKLIAIDLETTDSSPEKGDIIQIGAVIVNEDLSIGETFNSYIKPLSDYRNPRAMEVNKISEETLASAPEAIDVMRAFHEFAVKERRPILAAWGAYFDIPFLKVYHDKIGIGYPFSHKSFDIKSVAIWEMAKRDVGSESAGLNKYVEYLGLEFKGDAHDALNDILMAVEVLRTIN